MAGLQVTGDESSLTRSNGGARDRVSFQSHEPFARFRLGKIPESSMSDNSMRAKYEVLVRYVTPGAFSIFRPLGEETTCTGVLPSSKFKRSLFCVRTSGWPLSGTPDS